MIQQFMQNNSLTKKENISSLNNVVFKKKNRKKVSIYIQHFREFTSFPALSHRRYHSTMFKYVISD